MYFYVTCFAQGFFDTTQQRALLMVYDTLYQQRLIQGGDYCLLCVALILRQLYIFSTDQTLHF